MNTAFGSTPLRALDVILRIARALLLLATILFATLTVIGLFVTTSVRIDGTTDDLVLSYTDPAGQDITIDGNSRSIVVEGARPTDDIPRFGSTDVTIDLEDRASRTTATAFAGLWFVLAWVAVTNVHGITRTALVGEAFSHENARRLGRVGWAAVAFAVFGTVMPRIMDAVIDTATLPITGFRTSSQVSDPWVWVVAGLLFITIGHAFERGVELEALDAATI